MRKKKLDKRKFTYTSLVFILTISCMISIYIVINNYTAIASKVVLARVVSATPVVNPTLVMNPAPVVTPTPTLAPIIQAKLINHNQINGTGVNSDKALEADDKKTAYLTFDDGPSLTVTPKILSVLKKYNVTATFFLIGRCVDSNDATKALVSKIYDEGNAIGNHSYSHDMKKLYPNNKVDTNYFITELTKTDNSLKAILGQDFSTSLIRMPGGFVSRKFYHDPNINVFLDKLKESKYHYVDWNASDSDSEGTPKTSAQILSLVKNTVGAQPKVIILMHDTYGKEETANALPSIIEYLKAKGYEFKTLK